jgi:predicted nuclease of predicted toxin-antitoxin system
MRVLLDNNVNQGFAQLIKGHEVVHARKMGWAELENGDLIAAAEREGFDVIVTADKQMQYQQTIEGRKISVLVLSARFIKWQDIEPLAPQVQDRLDNGFPKGSFLTISQERQGDP